MEVGVPWLSLPPGPDIFCLIAPELSQVLPLGISLYAQVELHAASFSFPEPSLSCIYDEDDQRGQSKG